MTGVALTNAAPSSATNSSLAESSRFVEMREGRASRSTCPVACELCRYRHNGHYAERRIMPPVFAERQISADQPCRSSVSTALLRQWLLCLTLWVVLRGHILSMLTPTVISHGEKPSHQMAMFAL